MADWEADNEDGKVMHHSRGERSGNDSYNRKRGRGNEFNSNENGRGWNSGGSGSNYNDSSSSSQTQRNSGSSSYYGKSANSGDSYGGGYQSRANDGYGASKSHRSDDYGGGSSSYGASSSRGGGGGGGSSYNRQDYNSGGRNDREPRRTNNYEFEESMSVRSEQIGGIIGRGGSNIKSLQQNYNVHIDIDKNELKVKVQGNSRSDIEKAINAIQEQSQDSQGGSRSNAYERRERNDDRYDKPPAREQQTYNDASNYNDDFESVSNVYQQHRNETSDESKVPIIKDFYKEDPDVTDMSTNEVTRLRKENNDITVTRIMTEGENGAPIPNPIWKFEQCFRHFPDLLQEVTNKGFTKPSPIQSQAWPVLLQGNDLIGIAQTGTGKTLAFLLPALIHTEFQKTPRAERTGPTVLILAPTRELALQIESETKKYPYRDMRVVCVYGGGNRQLQISEMESGAEVVICTPGRLNDLIQAKVINVSNVSYFILDEADRMLDMGFEPQIRKVVLDIRRDRQTVMTSATWPHSVRRLAESLMQNPVQIFVGSLDLAATHSVKQVIDILEEDEKYDRLKSFLKGMDPNDKVIVFCSKKAGADDVASNLALDGFIASTLHGSCPQEDREQALKDIKTGYSKILIATDLASRGIDIQDLSHIVNYDMPRNIEEYVHRIGRTGRAGRTGISISFVTKRDWDKAPDLIKILEEANQEVPHELQEMANRFSAMKERRGSDRGFGRGGRGGGGGRGRGGRRNNDDGQFSYFK